MIPEICVCVCVCVHVCHVSMCVWVRMCACVCMNAAYAGLIKQQTHPHVHNDGYLTVWSQSYCMSTSHYTYIPVAVSAEVCLTLSLFAGLFRSEICAMTSACTQHICNRFSTRSDGHIL